MGSRASSMPAWLWLLLLGSRAQDAGGSGGMLSEEEQDAIAAAEAMAAALERWNDPLKLQEDMNICQGPNFFEKHERFAECIEELMTQYVLVRLEKMGPDVRLSLGSTWQHCSRSVIRFLRFERLPRV